MYRYELQSDSDGSHICFVLIKVIGWPAYVLKKLPTMMQVTDIFDITHCIISFIRHMLTSIYYRLLIAPLLGC